MLDSWSRSTTGMFLLLLLLALSASRGEVDDYLRAVDDMLAYKISFKPYEDGMSLYPPDGMEVPEEGGDDAKKAHMGERSWVSMISADQEEYQCLLPPSPDSLV